MIRGALGSRYGISPLGRGVIRPVSGGWWLSGGIAAANCVAAYQPKGAADYAASLVNLANSGTYDAANGTAYPTWDGTSGWKFASASSQYLTTGVVPLGNQTWSAVVRFSNNSTNYGSLFGCRDVPANCSFYIAPLYAFNKRAYGYGGYNTPLIIAGNKASGVIGIAGNTGFVDGSTEAGTITATGSAGMPTIIIGGNKYSNGEYKDFSTAYIQAIAFYNAIITTDQITALTTAMAAL